MGLEREKLSTSKCFPLFRPTSAAGVRFALM
jgi:hypothetical protein